MKLTASIKNLKQGNMSAEKADVELEMEPEELVVLIKHQPKIAAQLVKAFVKSVFTK